MKLFDRWSEEEIQILHDNYQNKTVLQLATMLDRTKNGVEYKLSNEKIKKERKILQLPPECFESKLCRPFIIEKLEKTSATPHKPWVPVLTVDLFYILGILQGDGCVYMPKQTKGGYMYVISLGSTDESFANEFSKSLKKIGLSAWRYIENRKPPRKKMYYVRSQSKSFLKWYSALDYNWILNTKSEEYKLYFLKGVYESDGSFQTSKKYTRVRVRNISYPLITTVKKLLEELGYTPTLFKMGENCLKSKKPYYAASLNRKAEVYDFLRRINPCIERKAV